MSNRETDFGDDPFDDIVSNRITNFGKDPFESFDENNAFGDIASRNTPNSSERKDDMSGFSFLSLSSKESNDIHSQADNNTMQSRGKVIIKMFLHEEVSSTQQRIANEIDEIESRAHVEGTIKVQVFSSDPDENPPFLLKIDDDKKAELAFEINKEIVQVEGERNIVRIDKDVFGKTLVASYSSSFNKKAMPLLLQSKIARSVVQPKKCAIAIQIRSNLNNTGSVKDLILVAAIPLTIIAETLIVIDGNGIYDDLRRTITWNVKEITKGGSLMVEAQAEVVSSLSFDQLPAIPVLIRCVSTDEQISSVKVNADDFEDYPVTMIVKKYYSFRLLHRVP